MAIIEYQNPTQPKPSISDRFRIWGNTIGNKVDSFFCRTIGIGCSTQTPAGLSDKTETVKTSGSNKGIIYVGLALGALLLLKK